MALENTPLSDGADDAGIARYIRASFAIVGNCVLCILHHSKRSKEAMASTDLISESQTKHHIPPLKLTVLRRLLHTCTLLFILIMPFNVSRQIKVLCSLGERPVAVITPRFICVGLLL